MMSQLSSLATKSKSDKVKNDERKEREREEREEKERKRIEKLEEGKRGYKVQEPISLITPYNSGVTSNFALPDPNSTQNTHTITRPPDVNSTRLKLPCVGMEQEIIEAVSSNPVTILCGETGSGKSTQVPQFLLEWMWGAGHKGMIGVTQPRRVAAVSTGKRVAYECGVGERDGRIKGKRSKGEGNLVGWQTRYESQGLGSKTRIKLMTDGILLSTIKSDLLLRDYGVVVLDEAHERTMNTDVLLGLIDGAVRLRKEMGDPLKVVIMSATLRVADFTENKSLFSSFGEIPVIRVPGRTHPVTIHHSKHTNLTDWVGEAVKKTCKIHRSLPPGGILVFLTGKDEIVKAVKKIECSLNGRRKGGRGREDEEEVATAKDDGSQLRDKDDEEEDAYAYQGIDSDSDSDSDDDDDDDPSPSSHPVLVLPLYSMLSGASQSKVFQPPPPNTRLIVVSTNIAETSVTIPGITYVVDSGREKKRSNDVKTGTARFQVEWISKAAADQRAGRAGRTGPGHCYRLYSSSVYDRQFEQFATPEMLARPIEDVVLAMKAMGIRHVGSFPFPSKPDVMQIRQACKMLLNLGCIRKEDSTDLNEEGTITDLGRALSKLPVGVRLGKVLVGSVGAGAIDVGIMLVSCLSEQSPFQGGFIEEEEEEGEDDEEETEGGDEVDKNIEEEKKEKARTKQRAELSSQWKHPMGDTVSRFIASGAYHHSGRNAGGATEEGVLNAFCKANGLSDTIMKRILTLRGQLGRVVDMRLGGKGQERGKKVPILPPPSRLQQRQISQLLCSGFLDRVARRAMGGGIVDSRGVVRRDAYIACSGDLKRPLYLSSRCALYERDWKSLPEFVVYENVIERERKGELVAIMDNVTRIEPEWLCSLARNSPLLKLGDISASPPPEFDRDRDAVVCYREVLYGEAGWKLPPTKFEMVKCFEEENFREGVGAQKGDNYVWFARLLLEGKVFEELGGLTSCLNEKPSSITMRKQLSKIVLLVNTLEEDGVDTKEKFERKVAHDDKYLWGTIKGWCLKEKRSEFKRIWGGMVKSIVVGGK
uniref:RNA helicase n=1 Tax=Triparma pacifica TaxID=91992 RepID=A0A7S2VW51_9STRA